MALDGIKEIDFNLWKQHPVTRMLYAYLSDFVVKYEQHLIDEWLAGRLSLLEENELRGRVLALREIVALEHRAIVEFYGEDTTRKPEAEADQD